jgi:hypothetical protein
MFMDTHAGVNMKRQVGQSLHQRKYVRKKGGPDRLLYKYNHSKLQERKICVQRWKSQRRKIHNLGYRFLNPYPRVRFSFWKSETFGISLKAFDSRIFS